MTTRALHPGLPDPPRPGHNIQTVESTEAFVDVWADEGRTLVPDALPDPTRLREVLRSVTALEYLGTRPAQLRNVVVLAHVAQSLHDPVSPCVSSGRVRAVHLGRAIDRGLELCSRCGDGIEVRMSADARRALLDDVERIRRHGPPPELLPLVGVGIHAMAHRDQYSNPLSSDTIMAQPLKPLNVIETLKDSQMYGTALDVILSDPVVSSTYEMWLQTEPHRLDALDDECDACW